jgi:hypothetical protein
MMDTAGIDGVLLEIFDELRVARNKHPLWPDDLVHGAAIVAEQAGGLTKACLQIESKELPRERARQEAKQVAVTAIRFILNGDAMACWNVTKHPDGNEES